MMRMRELTDDPPLGQGVVWRSIDSTAVHRAAYRLVIAVQATAALLRRGAVLLARSGLTGYPSAGCAVRSG
jgi:hypothetical protein